MPYDSIEFPGDGEPSPCGDIIAQAVQSIMRQRAAAVEETIAGYLKRYPGCSIERVAFTDNRIVERVICREARA